MTEFLVHGMSCGHCVDTVTEAILRLDPTAEVRVNLDTKHVRILSDLESFVLSSALTDAGYDPIPVATA